MLSLAPLKYRNILKENGGPVEKLTWSKAQIAFDTEGFEASCLLQNELRKGTEIFSLYENVDGTGSDLYKSTACNKAISEALERWAYYDASNGNKFNENGFHIDPTTTGMAAFPGVTKNSAKIQAQNEALERWALVEWWSGNLTAKKTKHGGLDCLKIPIAGYGVVCISWANQNEKWAYGFACAKNFEAAFKKAQIELFRNIHVLSEFKGTVENLILQEKRVLYFSSQNGHKSFLYAVEKSAQIKSQIIPKQILSKEITGPWSQYCTVWRCLFANEKNNLDDLEFFLF